MNGPFMPAGRRCWPPLGWIDMVRRAGGLVRPRQPAAIVALTPERHGELTAVHKQVGHDVTFQRDLATYGREDWWARPTFAKAPAGLPAEARRAKAGDCEDFALAYRARLVEAHGWPAGALRLALCETETGERHVVLTCETTGGTWILDNRLAAPVLWTRLLPPGFGGQAPPAYRWLARERPGRFLWERIGEA